MNENEDTLGKEDITYKGVEHEMSSKEIGDEVRPKGFR